MSAGKIQSRKAAAPAHGKKPLQEPITAIADKVTGIGARENPSPAEAPRTAKPRARGRSAWIVFFPAAGFA